MPYVHRAGGDITPALAAADPGEIREDSTRTAPMQVSLVWALALLAALLLLPDLWVLARDAARVSAAAREART